ncbi:MFS general substrate transporter [Meredithblackwellia eburnea MCA 4105]
MSEISEKKDVESTMSPATPVTDHPVHHVARKEAQLDSAAAFATGIALSEEDNTRLRRKVDRYLLPPMMFLYFLQFLDKTSLGQSVLLGVKTSNHISQSQYNWLNTIFYLAYLVFEIPQNLALQRFPVAKYMGANIIAWSIVLMCHAACKSFGGLFTVRLLLGVAEGSVTSGFMIITSQWYTRAEQGQRVGLWFLMNGVAQIVNGFISFGLHHVKSTHLKQWQILFLITGSVSFLMGVVWILYFPDSPTTAWFLTQEERGMCVERIRQNQAGMENKTFKRHQFIEAITDPKVLLFALFSLIQNIPNSLTNQFSTIYTELGFTTLQSTYYGIPNGVVEIFTIALGILCLRWFPNQRGFIAVFFFIPDVLGAILVIALPFHNKYGILGALYITGFGTTGFVIALSWLQGSISGHTKRVTAQGLNLVGYCVGNLIGPQIWQAKYAPRNVPPWITVIVAYTIAPALLLVIRYILAAENKRRDAAKGTASATDEEDVVDIKHADGTVTVERVDKAFMDMTDKENQDFRYPL